MVLPAGLSSVFSFIGGVISALPAPVTSLFLLGFGMALIFAILKIFFK